MRAFSIIDCALLCRCWRVSNFACERPPPNNLCGFIKWILSTLKASSCEEMFSSALMTCSQGDLEGMNRGHGNALMKFMIFDMKMADVRTREIYFSFDRKDEK